VAATNRDLRADVNNGGFRADLFYRLSTIRVRVPSLHERENDVLLLATQFYSEFAKAAGRSTEPPAHLLEKVLQHSWPGNVRELRAFVERALVLGDAEPAETTTPQFDLSLPFRESKGKVVQAWERDYLRTLMRTFKGNVSKASREVRMDRNHLRDLLQRHDIDPRRA
jgi:DNA-binding NtrC family response regulator